MSAEPAPSAADLTALLDALPPWASAPDFTEAEWERYRAAAKVFSRAAPATVAAALQAFVRQSLREEYRGYEDESKPFILMRVLFDLPDRTAAGNWMPFKGWINWPPPQPDGSVNPGWPVRWSGGRPELEAPYSGSMGLPYAAAEEYDWLRQRYPFRSFAQ
jgi:hypothetical protein